MTVFLVDYENVNAKGMIGIDCLDKENKVYLFYSQNANTLTFDLHKHLCDTNADVELIKVTGKTKNSLDFQLVTFLGYLIAKDDKAEYIIVSNDEGFSSTIAFWSSKKIKISAATNLHKGTKAVLKNQNETEAALPEQLKELIPDNSNDIPKVISFIEKYKTKASINTALVKEYGADKAGAIYKAIKPLLAKIKTA